MRFVFILFLFTRINK